jgi:S-DNA-T family DNA segregation ATPase FtsK/SpoIIIE
MPHLLIAGSTGTGKSVCINALLSSILMRATPAETRLILIDPKRIELSMYNGVPHLYVPVVTEAKEAASALAWAVSEMDRRLKVLQKAGVRNIASYNGMVHAGKLEEGAEQMPYLVIVIDELADLMMVAAKEVEDSICRLAQLARAAGIHLIVATQRPSTDIITGLIKTNITNRIAFAVGSSIDSRVILDQPGAEKLIGLGDMLFSIPSWPKPKRIQGAFVSEEEIAAAVDHLKAQGEPEYHEEILHLKIATVGGGVDTGDDDDPLIWEAADIVVTSGMGSTSLLQRRLKVGYARAGRIMDMLESKGIVGQPDGSRPRDVLVDIEDLESIKAMERLDAENEEE